ncbi:hypothetical protein Aspvir_001731, partial [Aspergillus viridinutans]
STISSRFTNYPLYFRPAHIIIPHFSALFTEISSMSLSKHRLVKGTSRGTTSTVQLTILPASKAYRKYHHNMQPIVSLFSTLPVR